MDGIGGRFNFKSFVFLSILIFIVVVVAVNVNVKTNGRFFWDFFSNDDSGSEDFICDPSVIVDCSGATKIKVEWCDVEEESCSYVCGEFGGVTADVIYNYFNEEDCYYVLDYDQEPEKKPDCPEGYLRNPLEGENDKAICCNEETETSESTLGYYYCNVRKEACASPNVFCKGKSGVGIFSVESGINVCCPSGSGCSTTYVGVPFCNNQGTCKKEDPGYCTDKLCCDSNKEDCISKSGVYFCQPKDENSCDKDKGETFCPGTGTGDAAGKKRCCPKEELCWNAPNGWPFCYKPIDEKINFYF